MNNWVKKLIQYGSCALFAGAIFAIYCISKNPFANEDKILVLGLMSDPFLISGVLLIAAGLFTYFNYIEFFDMIRYGFISLIWLFTPSKRDFSNRYTYSDYKDRLTKKGRHWYPFLINAGVVSIIISILIIIIYAALA